MDGPGGHHIGCHPVVRFPVGVTVVALGVP